ncbi:ATP-dependent helicase [Risungbinella massiliensis]|uniref:ATP-dependent helicase n=1 Tax=Risungbinella massiliensis TaxID=1329796 RepID=UPI0005CC8044|nr:ATP-dependent helicase [Risungbinella massiliensis]
MKLEDLFFLSKFHPNPSQSQAIQHLDNPLFLIAGPGSGKTRVLLWRVINLIVFKKVDPSKIFLSTFTEKAAKQLKDGLQNILGLVTNQTGQKFDLSQMYVGTVHSLCQRVLSDRRFVADRSRRKIPVLMDELDQYFFLRKSNFWEEFLARIEMDEETFRETAKSYFYNRSQSKHYTLQSMMSLFNRWSEDNLSISELREFTQQDDFLDKLVTIYEMYIEKLAKGQRKKVDFSLLQQEALHLLSESEHVEQEFEHIIIDEYQDTNSIQEQIFFKLAKGHKNICVVGDDDQALYRFRGATVENFVQFPERCEEYMGVTPTSIKLSINYRSQKQIVDFYTSFIDQEDWSRPDNKGFYRLADKGIQAHSQDTRVSVIASTNTDQETVAKEIAELVKQLLDEGRVSDPNQIAFLFPSLHTKPVQLMKQALEDLGIKVYVPRATKFLELEELMAMFGLFLKIFGKPEDLGYKGSYREYFNWMDQCLEIADQLMSADEKLHNYILQKQAEVQTAIRDYLLLMNKLIEQGWEPGAEYLPEVHKLVFKETLGLSQVAIKGLGSHILDRIAEKKKEEGTPFSLQYIINRATSVDWSVLDLFYRLCGFKHFKEMFDLAEQGIDEGPICNLSQITKYLARYMDQYQVVISGKLLAEQRLVQTLFSGYLYALFLLGETELENDEEQFPKGRVPFLTIHQSKGLEFPVVVLGSLHKQMKVQRTEEIVRPMIQRDAEPLDQVPTYDAMRLFYVALSRAENLLIIANPRGRGVSTYAPFQAMLGDGTVRIPQYNSENLAVDSHQDHSLPKVYSYTSDYLLYQKCARQYMIFRKYGFVPSRSQTMFFGTLVHKTIEDLHNRIIAEKGLRV